MIRSRSIKNAFFLISLLGGLFLLNVFFTGEPSSPAGIAPSSLSTCSPARKGPNISELSCTADGGRPMKCYKSEDEVYFPFSFLKKQFGIAGKLSKGIIVFF